MALYITILVFFYRVCLEPPVGSPGWEDRARGDELGALYPPQEGVLGGGLEGGGVV